MHIVKDIMQFGVRTVQADTPVYQAIATMAAKHLTSLPVVNDDMSLVGIISEKDVLELLYNFKEGSVADFMVENPVSFNIEDSIEDVCRCFRNSSFRRIPILKDGRVVSVITRTDIIKTCFDSNRFENLDNSITDKQPEFTAKDVMAYGLYTVRRKTPIREAVDIILKRKVTGLPVVDHQMNLHGVITEKDILNQICYSGTNVQFVEDIMSSNVVTFDCKDNMLDICDCLLNNDFRRVLITDQEKLVGIISRTDIIAFILKNKTAILKNRIALSETV